MARRLDLHTRLLALCENVYFQPPPTVVMKYPCIVYHREQRRNYFANNQPYQQRKRYLVTVIDRDPDSDLPDKVSKLPLCIFDRFFTSDGLNHDVFKLHF